MVIFMKVLGIIAEYNPFHNGHRYLIEEAKAAGRFDVVICIMSGNFVQRGDTAICSKWARAEMALRCGVDLVLELPFAYAVRSAYYFAWGAIQSLYNTGVVTHLAFGSESGDLEKLREIARLLANEPEDYQRIIKKHLAKGISYPSARSQAICDYLGTANQDIEAVLRGPNNILAIEYLKVIEELKLPLRAFTITRKGSGYHRQDLNSLASAAAIRAALLNPSDRSKIIQSMPSSSFRILQREIENGLAPIQLSMLEQSIFTMLRNNSVADIGNLYEVSEGLEYRIYEAARTCGTLDKLQQNIKSRRYSLTRINRILVYSVMGITHPLVNILDGQVPAYLRVLGLAKKASFVLEAINKASSWQVLNRGKDVKRFYEEHKGYPPGIMLGLDIRATDIYSLLMPNRDARNAGRDFTVSPVIIP